ncbi:acyl-CoA N-acyltransferase [Aspergillus japonicus CBS 114.51]|uniref:Acyl-CoA N-acyltransferase n=1 Tax=Aspergillus japonicus CBS 114.51 TaxID=1448312 RepID=A0A8T8XBH5_ASPJA|nr:acyl-CoA N-acyltransferase [Aspergillus japonicus CBS 114.51]RAH85583.1 acyl-CoA N-acyltransferase [Aspergillus japonicus CBS 114.51]
MQPKYTIRPATPQDAPHLAHINITAFEPTPFWRNLFPNLDRTATYPLKLARTLTKLVDGGASHLLVAADPATGRVVGYARWTLPGPSGPPSPSLSLADLPPEHAHLVTTFRRDGDAALPPGTNRAVHRHFWGELDRLKAKYLREGDFVLEFLATLPEAQGQGVASALLRWGLARADACNARVYLEATAEGYPVYRKYGWRDLEVLELDFAALGGRAERQRWVVMMREGPGGESLGGGGGGVGVGVKN